MLNRVTAKFVDDSARGLDLGWSKASGYAWGWQLGAPSPKRDSLRVGGH